MVQEGFFARFYRHGKLAAPTGLLPSLEPPDRNRVDGQLPPPARFRVPFLFLSSKGVLSCRPFPLEPGFFQITALIRPRRTSFTGWFFVAIIASFSNLESMSHRLTWLPLLCGRTVRVLHRGRRARPPHSRQPPAEDRAPRIVPDGQMSDRTCCRSHRRSMG